MRAGGHYHYAIVIRLVLFDRKSPIYIICIYWKLSVKTVLYSHNLTRLGVDKNQSIPCFSKNGKERRVGGTIKK